MEKAHVLPDSLDRLLEGLLGTSRAEKSAQVFIDCFLRLLHFEFLHSGGASVLARSQISCVRIIRIPSWFPSHIDRISFATMLDAFCVAVDASIRRRYFSRMTENSYLTGSVFLMVH